MIGGRARTGVVAAALVASLACARSGRAEPPEPRAGALAQVLFEEAVALMEAGHFDEACPKLAESQRLDPAGGTLLNLASCLESQGLLASAYATYADAASAALRDGRKDREAIAREKLAAIQPRMARLELRVPNPAPGLEIKLDGIKLGAASWGTALPIDPGSHEVELSAPGRRRERRAFVVARDAARVTIDLPALEAEAPPAAAPPAQATEEPPPRTRSNALAVGLVVGGATVTAAGLVVGAVALANKGTSDDHCPTSTTCDDEGVAAMGRARSLAWTANVAIGLGLVATVGGVVLWAVQPRNATARMLLSGTF